MRLKNFLLGNIEKERFSYIKVKKRIESLLIFLGLQNLFSPLE
ncbi:hypothetical protein D931_02547 [Enterococcus faecium 13.SD.W.09]|nr:hypothetical protein D931_02547 [Enterococcus faecium 13.SD.W.09]